MHMLELAGASTNNNGTRESYDDASTEVTSSMLASKQYFNPNPPLAVNPMALLHAP